MGFIKPNNNSGGSGGGLTPQELSRLNNAYTHSKSEHAPTTAEQNVQPDWNETDTTSDAYIKNKPDLSQIGSGGNIPSVTQIEPQELDMPKVFFYGNALPTTKDNVNLTMDYISNTAKFSSFVKLKCQGTSSMSYAKKNFTVSMFSDEARATKLKKDFKGWGAQSKFCLKANYVDTTHTRNISGARIAYDMVASRPDSTFKQQLLQCPRNGLVDGFPIKLYFNGEFYGIYTWNIPKDTWMFNMDKNNLNHIVLCAERNTDGNANAINSCQFRQLWTNGDGQDWSVEVGTMSEDLRTKFNRVIAFVMNATDQEFHDNIGEYFDLYSLLDYYCFSYLTCHLDGLAKNMLMVTYDGVHWGASLYDMDSIYGVSWNGANYVATNYQCPEQYQEQFSRLWVRIEQCFATELYARYLELRQGALSLSNIIKHVEEIYDVIPDRVFADEKAKWTSLPNVNTNTMTRFRNYMRDRAVYVDAQMETIGIDVPCTGITLDKTELALGVFEGGVPNENIIDVNLNENITPGREIYGTTEAETATTTKLLTGLIDVSGMDNYLYVLDVIGTTESDQRYAFYTAEESIVTANAINNDPSYSCLNIARGANTYPYIKVMTNSIDGNNTIDTIHLFKISKDYLSTVLEDFTSDAITGTSDVYVPVSVAPGDIVIIQGDKDYWTGMSFINTGLDIIANSKSADYKATFIPKGKDTLYFKIAPAMYTAGKKLKYKIFKPSDLMVTDVVEKLSSRITATVTPTNCTDEVVWSVSPTGIATVNNGLVTAVTNGEATVTATCGSQSANCAVTVSGMSESGGDTPGGGNTGDYVTDSLYAYYDLTQLSTEATTVEDLSGNNNTFNVISGTLTKDDLGGLIYSTNPPCINSGTFNPQTAEASIEYTFKYTGENNCNQQNNYTNRTCGINGENGQGYYSWAGGFGYCIFKSNTQITTDTPFPNTLVNGEYYHIVCTISDNEAKYYLNGELLGTYSHVTTGIPNNTTYYIGATSSSRACSNQVLYSSRFYNKVLTQDEITQNYTYEFTKLGLISGGDTDIYATAEYAITEPRTFNGTSDYIDTGIKLFDTAKTFTIFVDYASTTPIEKQAVIFHCIHEASPYRGLCLMKNANDATYFIGGQAPGQNAYAFNMPSTGKYLISFVNGVINNVVTVDDSNNLVYSATDVASNNPYVQVTENLLLGCYQTTNGTKGRFWTGTINKFGVWYKQLTENEINQVFGKSGVGSDVNTNYLANASWQDGTLNMTNTGMTSSTDDKYTSIQIPTGRYMLTSTNATWKKFRLNDSEGNVMYYNSGANNANDLIIDTTIYDDVIFTLEISYYKPNDTIEVPSLIATTESNIITLTLDGSLSYSIPEWPHNPSGENGQVNAEYLFSDIHALPSCHVLKGYTHNNNIADAFSKGLAKQYRVSLWNNKLYLSFTLDMAETGVTNDVESVTNYLSNNPLIFKYVM